MYLVINLQTYSINGQNLQNEKRKKDSSNNLEELHPNNSLHNHGNFKNVFCHL